MKLSTRCRGLKLIVTNLFMLTFLAAFGQDAVNLKDEAYGKDSLQKMDVYLLPNRTPKTPVVILVHGGGWMAGDKEACNFMRDFLTAQGINIININYRLASTGKITYKEIMADMDLAIEHIVKKSGEWQIRKDKYVFWGGSAGGHLAMLYAYKYDKRNVISAVTTLGGPTKLDDLETLKNGKKEDLEGLLPLITGDKWQPGSFAESYKKASPYYGPSFKPTLLMHGEKDTIVPLGQAQIMYKHLQENHVPVELIVLENGAHGGEGTSAETSKKMAVTILEWIKKYGV